jgi:DNA primase
MIPQQFVEEVQSRTDIVELISSYIPLKRAGRNFKTLCPFHGEKTPSFMISPQKQIFHCFGCGEGGGVFQFLTLIEKVTFPEAVEILAKRLGLSIPYEKGKITKEKTVLYEIMEEAASFFHNNLKDVKEHQPVINYLEKRGITKETINVFRIGYAPGNNSLLNHLRKQGFTLENLEKVSLVLGGTAGFRDLFHNRITFPIFDVRSRIVGFGARLYKDIPDSPKYINSLENILYSKREHLFGLNFSKDEIVKLNSAVIVEGYLDMITPFMHGIKNIVASLGTALTNEQIRLLKRYTSCVILIYDSDKAGQLATLRSVDLLLESDLKVQVAALPSGYDPDSLIIKKGKDVLFDLIEKRQDFFDYKLGVLRNIYDSGSIEGKTKIANEMLATINKLNSEIEKYEYIKKLALNLGVKEEIMIAEFRNTFSKNNAAPKKTFVASVQKNESYGLANEPLTITEKVIIKSMLNNPKAFSIVKKNLKEEHFSSYLAKKTVSFLFKSFSEEEKCSLQKILGVINDKEVNKCISEILMDDDIPLDKEIFKDSLLKLRKKAALQLKNNLRGKIKEAEARGDRQKLSQLINEYGQIR